MGLNISTYQPTVSHADESKYGSVIIQQQKMLSLADKLNTHLYYDMSFLEYKIFI